MKTYSVAHAQIAPQVELLREKGISEEEIAAFYASMFDMAVTTGSGAEELEALRERVGENGRQVPARRLDGGALAGG